MIKMFENEARKLFLKYAIPSLKLHIERGILSEEGFEEAVKAVAENKEPENIEKSFAVAEAMCYRYSNGKVNEKTVREYFLFKHDEVIEKKAKLIRNFDSERCRVYRGEVLQVEDGYALVKTPLEKRRYRTDFIHEIKKGGIVSVHYDFVVEELTADILKGMEQ